MGLLSDMCTSCGNRVKKAARFCSTCGSQAPEGWVRCGGCTEWVGNDSGFCPHCNHALCPEERDLIVSGKLYRDQAFFIQRVSLAASRESLPETILVGDNCLVINPKQPTELLATGGAVETSGIDELILVGNEEVAVPLRVEKMICGDGCTLSVYTEVIIQADMAAGEALCQSLLNPHRNRTLKQIVHTVENDLVEALTQTFRDYELRDLMLVPEKRLEFEQQLERSIAEMLLRVGLRTIRVTTPQLEGNDVSELLQKHKGEVEIANRIAFQSRLIRLNSTLEKDKVRSEQEVETLARQLAFESELETADIGHEVDLLKQVHRHDLGEKEAAFEMKQSMVKLEQELIERRKNLDYEIDEARQWLDVRKTKKQDDQDLLFQRLREFDKYDTKALLSVLPEEQGKSLVELAKIQGSGTPTEASLSPEQVKEILACMDTLTKQAGEEK